MSPYLYYHWFTIHNNNLEFRVNSYCTLYSTIQCTSAHFSFPCMSWRVLNQYRHFLPEQKFNPRYFMKLSFRMKIQILISVFVVTLNSLGCYGQFGSGFRSSFSSFGSSSSFKPEIEPESSSPIQVLELRTGQFIIWTGHKINFISFSICLASALNVTSLCYFAPHCI